jgi:hypothetical protein
LLYKLKAAYQGVPVDEPATQPPRQKSSLVEVAKKRIAQPKVWIPTAIVVASLLVWSLFNLRQSTLFPLSLKARDWTGFGADSTTNTERDSADKVIKTVEVGESSKTLWDWLSVLGVPLTLALLGFWFQWLQQKQTAQQAEVEKERAIAQAEVERARTEKQAEVEKEIAEIARKEEAIQVFFDRLSDLLVDKNLIAIASRVQSFCEAKEEGSGGEKIKLPALLQDQKEQLDAAVDVIRARTLAILRRLEGDADRKASVMQFLLEAEVVQKLKLSLSYADLSDANLYCANLSDANLYCADLSDANLYCADLSRADLIDANLSDANLYYARLSRADLIGAKLSRANLTCANLSNADLSIANLSGTNLIGADLSDADLNCADLIGADLSDANLSRAKNWTENQLTRAKLCKTKLPPGLNLNPNRDCEELESE